MRDASEPFDRFLDAVAARSPTPGGGAVAAAGGALAAAMGEMVLQYSVGKKGLESHQGELADALGRFARARRLMLQLMVEDQSAYEALRAARVGSDPAAVAAAVRLAVQVPQSIAATAAAVLETARQVAPLANRHLLSDLAVCAELAMATVRCALCNVRVNLADVVDQGERQRLADWCEATRLRSVSLIQELMPITWSRLGL
ncbi:MAG: cyclodeaminase/cyclohydrolase family protein [Phycisphaerales bacterium]|nr:cyclodeaminase/cyclohydrolase family protein [Phycisphaerales bacterium]